MIPNMIKKNDIFEGFIELPTWNAYWKKHLKLELNVGGDCLIDQVGEIHKAGYEYLIFEQKSILNCILEKIYNRYGELQDQYEYADDEKEIFMPDLSGVNELASIVNPKRIYIMDVSKDDFPYIGYEFNCKWDEEHGLGLMLYKTRAISIGGAENAFLSWVAETDFMR